MSALGRALKHVGSGLGVGQPAPQHRARWQARRQERQQARQQQDTGTIVLKAADVPDTARSRASVAWSDVASSRGSACRPEAAGSCREDGNTVEERPAPRAGDTASEARVAPGLRQTGQRRSASADSLVQREASDLLDSTQVPQTGEHSRVKNDRRAELKRSKLRSEVRKAIAREGIYRDPHIDGGTVVRVGMAGGPQADNRPVVDRHGRFFGMGAMGRARQVAHAQEVMAGGPLTPESNRRVLPLAIPVTPKMAAAPHSGGSPMLLHTHLNPSGDSRKQGGFARRPSAELRALDSLYETKLRGGKPRQYHHLGGARNTDTVVGAGYVVEGPPKGYVTGPLTEVHWGPTAVERGRVAPSAAVVSNTGGLGVREYTAVQPPVRKIGGASDPHWERRRPVLHKLHPDAEELLELQKGWNEGWDKRGGRRVAVRSAGGYRTNGTQWTPPLVENLHELHGRLVGNWESEDAAAAASESGREVPLERSTIGTGTSMPAVFSHSAQPIWYGGEYRRSLSLREALDS